MKNYIKILFCLLFGSCILPEVFSQNDTTPTLKNKWKITIEHGNIFYTINKLTNKKELFYEPTSTMSVAKEINKKHIFYAIGFSVQHRILYNGKEKNPYYIRDSLLVTPQGNIALLYENKFKLKYTGIGASVEIGTTLGNKQKFRFSAVIRPLYYFAGMSSTKYNDTLNFYNEHASYFISPKNNSKVNYFTPGFDLQISPSFGVAYKLMGVDMVLGVHYTWGLINQAPTATISNIGGINQNNLNKKLAGVSFSLGIMF